jgi:hypothetical protein
MPSCNLVERIYHTWLKQLGNKMACVYEAIVVDLVRAFMQTINYWAWLKGGASTKRVEVESCSTNRKPKAYCTSHEFVPKSGRP